VIIFLFGGVTNMLRQTIIISILIGAYLSSPVFAVGKGPAYRYLKQPAVKWSGERLTGEIKNAPLASLLTELLRMEGFNWEVIGNLGGTISVSFDHLTINDSIKKIMRLNRFNYALIFDERPSRDANSTHLIKELTIYQRNQKIRFSRTADQIPAPKKKKVKTARETNPSKIIAAMPAKPVVKKSNIRKTQPSKPTKEEMAAIDKELRAFAEEMLAGKKITQEEYNEMVGETEAKK
jgi:hypothetical protein